MVLCRAPALTPALPTHTVTSLRQHGPQSVVSVTSSGLWPPRGALEGRGLRSAPTTESPCSADPELLGGLSASADRGLRVTAVTFKRSGTHSSGVPRAATGVRVCTGVCRVKAAHQSCRARETLRIFLASF